MPTLLKPVTVTLAHFDTPDTNSSKTPKKPDPPIECKVNLFKNKKIFDDCADIYS